MRRILVTGANKGIGLAIVRAIVDEHDDTFVLLGSRDEGRGHAARDGIVQARPAWADRVEVLPLDVADDRSVAGAAQRVRDRFDEAQPLYGIVNNAGVGFTAGLDDVLNVNVRGIHRVCTAFLPLLHDDGRVVNVTSASGPNYVSACTADQQRFFLDSAHTWADLDELDFETMGLDTKDSYGLSKALANTYTLLLARQHPNLRINACTPGFIETDMTRPYAEASGRSPADMGMKAPADGARSPMHLLFGELAGNGWYYGSDAQRSPLDRYRAPGTPPYTAD